MSRILQSIDGPRDLKALSLDRLPVVAAEIRELITTVLERNGGHLASGLGVVDLTIALHYVYDFLFDRIIFDVSHQCYPHKILTGRREAFETIRLRHGLSGYTNPAESPYDHFMFAHAGTSISTALGLAVAAPDDGSRTVAVIGDASIASGNAIEALNNVEQTGRDVLVILNDNEMSISRSVGALSEHLQRIRAGSLWNEIKKDFHRALQAIPLIGERLDQALVQAKDILSNIAVPGHVFDAFGPRYFGPIDGHNIPLLVKILTDLRAMKGFIFLHVVTKKGMGLPKAVADPIKWHGVSPKLPPATPPDLEFERQGETTYSQVFGDALLRLGRENPAVIGITAAMPDNTCITTFQKAFPERTFDVGICEQHGVAFAAGLARGGKRPVCAIFSTFLQRAFDQLFQEIALNRQPVLFCMDRAGIVGPDGATHNGCFDIAFVRALPGIVVMAPRDATELGEMMEMALRLDQPSAIRYPRTFAPNPEREYPRRREMLPGRAETLRQGRDAAVFAYGSMVYPAMEAAEKLAAEGIDLTVVNARFARPVDLDTLGALARRYRTVFTAEEHTIQGGFAGACLEALASAGLPADVIVPVAIPDRFVEHGTRSEMLRELGLDPTGLMRFFRERLAERKSAVRTAEHQETA